MVANIDWWLNKVIMISCSILLGAFFVHWNSDFVILWSPSSAISPAAIEASLSYYHKLLQAPPMYWGSLGLLVALSLAACAIKIVMNPLKGMLFDGATFMLMLSGVSVYMSNFRTALEYLPAEGTAAASTLVESFKLKDALLTLASSNMIIAVTLTGVLAIQSAQGFANRTPPSALEPVADKK